MQETPDPSALTRALDQLPSDRRLLILLCYHHNMTHPLAADILAIPVMTVCE